jgi:hypothetical protein
MKRNSPMTLRRFALFLVLAGGMPFSGNHAQAQNPEIVFEDEEGDLTFFYNSDANQWVTVFRDKGSEATGLTTLFSGSSTPATWAGIVGNAPTSDYLFSKLTTEVKTRAQVTVGATTFYVSAAEGSPFFEGPGADLGIRTRLRENFTETPGANVPPATNQFDSFNLRLRPGDSTFNGNPLVGSGAFVSLLFWDTTDPLNPLPVPLIDSATGDLTANFGNYEHRHRNWGFSQYGEYSLAFDLEGVGGVYGDTAEVGSTTIGFAVAVPEPGTLGLAGLGMAGTIAGFRWLRRRRRPEAITEDSSDEA